MSAFPGRANSTPPTDLPRPQGSTANNPFVVDEHSIILTPRRCGTAASNPFFVDENGLIVTLPWEATAPSGLAANADENGRVKDRIGLVFLIQVHVNSLHLLERPQGHRPPYHAHASAPVQGQPVITIGYRRCRARPLHVNDLYLTDARPPAESEPRPHHECSVCYGIKSHPVCWTCPECWALLQEAPIRNYDGEKVIAFDHPEWQDLSVVDYNFDDLRFPL
ncbi:hypothetical protein DFH06DRAFT_1319357 [Mycena polygramma]|nr:hypothetical protein DFH06DRAFT_1319357 [Mycena polygramma]